MTTLATAGILFCSSFVVVFLLGVQQLNVERRSMLAAGLTSPLIALATLVQFKLLPGPTGAEDVAGYLLGGAAGIVAGIWAHPRLVAFAGRRRGAVRKPAEHAERAERLGETLRLATRIADECARADIESWCATERVGRVTWYDTASAGRQRGPEYAESIADALRYLRLRDRITVHPEHDHLVRFA